jgi:DNA-binding NtrC family response regulator
MKPAIARNGSRYRVLCVDDDPAILFTMSAILEDDVEVASAQSPIKALEMIRADPFHVVCSDFQMPEMDGCKFIQQVAAMTVPTSCLILTGSPHLVPKEAFASQELFSIVEKPYDPERFVSLLIQLARLTEVRRAAQQICESKLRRALAHGR